MAKSTSFPLFEAWFRHQIVLYPNGPDWRTILERWVTHSLSSFNPNAFPTTIDLQETASPPWRSSLTVSVDEFGAKVSIPGHEIGPVPWIGDAQIEWSPDWLRINPFAKLVSYGTRDDATVRQCVRECSRLLTNVTRRADERMKSDIMNALRTTVLDATGVSSLDGYAKRKKLTLEQMKMIETMDIANNRLLFRPGVPTIENVEVSRGPGASASTRSFAELDDLLIEEMHHMILERPRLSVAKAAKAVLPKAPRQLGSDDDSVIERLRRGYGRKYPTKRS